MYFIKDDNLISTKITDFHSILFFQLPLDLTKLSDEERAIRKLKQSGVRKEEKKEDVEVDFDANEYVNMWKR